MYVQRRPSAYRPRRRGPNLLAIVLGCGAVLGMCAVLTVVGVLVALPRLPGLAAQVAGLSPRGPTSNLFDNASVPPPVQIQNPAQPAQITVNLGEYGGAQTLSTDSGYYDVAVGADQSGQQTAVVTFDEAGLTELCRQRSEICSGADPRFQNARIDLKPGGAILYADVTVPTDYGFTIQQTAGVVLQLDSSQTQFVFAGVDLNGQLYADPPPELSEQINQLEQTGNDLLTQVTVDAGAGTMALSEVIVDETTLSVVLR